MPWCPKCKAEYQDGYTVCSDCNVDLVEELVPEEETLCILQAKQKEIAEKLLHYFEHSKLQATLNYNEEYEVYEVLIPPELEKQAKKLYQAFYYIEQEKYESSLEEEENDEDFVEGIDVHLSEDTEVDFEEEPSDSDEQEDGDTDEEGSEPVLSELDDFKKMDELLADSKESELRKESSTYVMKADQYNDLNSTVIIFLLFGIAGMIFIILNITGVISIMNSWLFYIIGSALFLYFIYVGISTSQKAKQVKAEIEEENKLTEQINEWLKNNFTKDFLASHQDENMSAELNYLKIIDSIHALLVEEFGEQDEAYLDLLIEEYYTNHFEKAEETENTEE